MVKTLHKFKYSWECAVSPDSHRNQQMCRVRVSGACMCRESSTVANAASIGDHDATSLVVMSVEQVLNMWVPHGSVVTFDELSFLRGGLEAWRPLASPSCWAGLRMIASHGGESCAKGH